MSARKTFPVGATIGHWTVVEKIITSGKRTASVCRCSCGHMKIIRNAQLRSGATLQCKECRLKRKNSTRITIGEIYKECLVIEYVEDFTCTYGRNRKQVRCICYQCKNPFIVKESILKNDTYTKKIRCKQCTHNNAADKRWIAKKSKKEYDPALVTWNKQFASTRKGALKRNIPFLLSLEEYQEIASQKCFYNFLNCAGVKKVSAYGKNSPLRSTTIEASYVFYSGIDRFDNSLGYFYENCVPCCQRCNSVKNTHSIYDLLFNADALISRKKELIAKYEAIQKHSAEINKRKVYEVT